MLSSDEAAACFQVRPKIGLGLQEVEERRQLNGMNQPPEPPLRSGLSVFLHVVREHFNRDLVWRGAYCRDYRRPQGGGGYSGRRRHQRFRWIFPTESPGISKLVANASHAQIRGNSL